MNIKKLSRDLEKVIKMLDIIQNQYSVGNNKDWTTVKAVLNNLRIKALIDEETDKDYTYWEKDKYEQMQDLLEQQDEIAKKIEELER